MDELEVLMDKHKPNLTSARKNLIQVLNELRIAYPKERRNIYDYDKCYTLMQEKDNSKKLYEIMKSFEEEIRGDYAVFPEKVFEEIMYYTKDLERESGWKQSKVENMTCIRPKNINANDVVGLENTITKFEFEKFNHGTLLLKRRYLFEVNKSYQNSVKKPSVEKQ
uniref:Uncharacterized protein n=1 Tax=Schistosoma japonicum TaxID=6182 RepID=Q5DHX2_SCHJA|nr:unknown [Schistosoma japonicum]